MLFILVISDLQTKLKLYLAVHPNKDSYFMKQNLRSITRNNICCELLDVYLDNPEIIGTIQTTLFDLRKDLILNLPMILNDLKEYILKSDMKVLDRMSGSLKSSLYQLKRMRQDYRTEYLTTRFYPILKKRIELPLVPIPDEGSISEMFPTIGTERVLGQLQELDMKGLPADYVSDYWKERVQTTIDYTKDLGVPLPKGKYGLESLSPAVQQKVALTHRSFQHEDTRNSANKSTNAKTSRGDFHIMPLPYLKIR